MIKEKKILEIEDAPSGFVTLYNYKEPFMKFEQGFGFQGVLLFDGNTDKVQCHICGEWLGYLPHHLQKEHNMRAAEYKDLVGLRQNTSLIGDKLREKMIANGMEMRKKNLRSGPWGKKKMSKETREKIRATLKKMTAEKQNETGTCPLQLIERVQKLADKLGRTPTHNECGFKETAIRVYGSWEKFIEWAGLEVRKVGQTVNHHKLGSTGRPLIYSNEELLTLLKEFKQRENREPVLSDVNRGLLPTFRTYKRHFGSWTKAKEQAGVTA